MPEYSMTNKTSVPLRWLIALLAGCATFTGTAVFTGMYFGGRDASAAALSVRVEKLEYSVDAMSLVDRRLARIEGALNIKVPEEDRLSASGKRHDSP